MKIVLPQVTSTDILTTVNQNFSDIVGELQDNVLYRKNPSGETNTFQETLDMDGNDIINVRRVTAQSVYIGSENILNLVVAGLGDATEAAAAAARSALSASISATSANSAVTTALGYSQTATQQAVLAGVSASAAAQSAIDAAASAGGIGGSGITGYQVRGNIITALPSGAQYTVRGVQMFDYLFCSFEARTNYNFRTIYSPPGKGSASGISEPTYYAPTQYRSAAYVETQMLKAQRIGVNTIRVGVEAAVMYATVSYVDPSNSVTYPSDPDMLDTIINTAARLGIVIQLQLSNDDSLSADNQTFLQWLMLRYYQKPNVWINPANEPLGYTAGGANVNSPTLWLAKMKPLVSTLMAAIPGAPAGSFYTNPICLDPPGYSERLDLIITYLGSDPVISAMPNRIINVHYYSQDGDSDFRTSRLPYMKTRWPDYLGQYCILVGEVGIDNFAGRFDPTLDPGVPSVNLPKWGLMQAAVADFLRWSYEQTQFAGLSGVIGHMWGAYIPGLGLHDDNSMYRNDGTRTAWGYIYTVAFLAMGQSVLEARRALGTDYATGAWSTGDIVNKSIIDSKIDNYSVFGAASRISNGTIGTPVFQAEGATGVRAAGAFIAQGNSDVYLGFYQRTTATLNGSISGNGSTGTIYATTSDVRLKDRIEDVEDAVIVSEVMKLHPVIAGWRSAPEADREIMFLAHELQEVFPTAVTGTKGQMTEFNGEQVILPQCVDYGRITPLLAAALKVALKRIEALEQRLGEDQL